MIVYKILFFILMFSILITLKNMASVLLSFIFDEKINFSKTNIVLLGLSLSYILTIIFTGFNL